MSDYYQFQPVPIGEPRSEGVVCSDAPDVPHSFTGAEALAATLFRLSDGAALAAPAVALTPGVPGGLTVTFAAADTIAAGVPGTYGCNVTVDGAPAVNGRVYLEAAPGYPPAPDDVSAYATEEDLATRARADYALLAQDDPALAEGAAGSFAAGDPWTLVDAAQDFAGRGVAPGDVVLLWGDPWPGTTDAAPRLYAVDSAGTTTLGLRHAGRPAGVGQPPGPAAGAAGFSYRIPTLRAKLAYFAETALRSLQEAGADPAADITAADLRHYVADAALADLYEDAWRQAKNDLFREKADRLRQGAAAALGRLAGRRGGVAKAADMAFTDVEPPHPPYGWHRRPWACGR